MNFPEDNQSVEQIKSKKNKELRNFLMRLLSTSGFKEYAQVIFSSRLVYDPDQDLIAKTDGVTISVNDDFFLLNKAQKEYLYMLELMHNALLHPQRADLCKADGYDLWLLNMTQNCLLNEMLKHHEALSSSSIKLTISEFVLWDYAYLFNNKILNPEDFDINDLAVMSAKQLHNILIQHGDEEALALEKLKMPEGDIKPELSQESIDVLESGDISNMPDELKEAAYEAMFKEAGNKAGTGSPFIDMILKQFPKPKKDWRRVLRVLASQTKSEEQDYSETLYNNDAVFFSDDPERCIPLEPALDFEDKAEKLGVALDLSYSVFGQEGLVAKFISELNNLQKTFNCDIHFITFDDGIVEEYAYDSGDEDFISKVEKGSISIKGAGGTNFIPVLDRFKEIPDVQKVLVLTDLEGPSGNPRDYAGLDITWVLPNPDKTPYASITTPPFGRLVTVD